MTRGSGPMPNDFIQ